MEATDQYFPVVLFIMLCKVVLTFDSIHIKASATEQYSLIAFDTVFEHSSLSMMRAVISCEAVWLDGPVFVDDATIQ